MSETMTTEGRVSSLEERTAKLEEFFTPIMEDNLIQYHGERIRLLSEALSAGSGTADSDVNPLVSPMEQLRRVVSRLHILENEVLRPEYILGLADKLYERADAYRQPYVDGNIEEQFHSSGSASTWAALRDVAMALSSLVDTTDEEPEIVTTYNWDDCAVEFVRDLEDDGYTVSVLDNDGLVVKTHVHLHEWSGPVTNFINAKNIDGLIEYLIGLNETTEGERDGTTIRR